MAEISDVTDETFENEVLKSTTPVLVDFWAEWCGPCKAIAPIVKEIADDNGDKLKVVKINDCQLTVGYEIFQFETSGLPGLSKKIAQPKRRYEGTDFTFHDSFIGTHRKTFSTRSRIPHQVTRTNASTTIQPDIFDVPRIRSTKAIGTSWMIPPVAITRYAISI